MLDYILNGAAHGNVAARLLQCGGDVGALRPYIGKDGRSYVTVNMNGKSRQIVTNAPATLRKDEWILLDQQLLKVAKPRLKIWTDLASAGLIKTIPNGLSKSIYQYQNVSDIAPADISMDGLAQTDRDRPVFDLVNLPLPIIHKDFSFSLREILTSRTATNSLGGGMEATASIDTTTAELAARRCAEELEKLVLGVTAAYSYGGGTIYGLTNYPYRDTKSMTTPTGSNAYNTLADVLDMKKKSQDMYHYGPWMLYNSTSWDQFLDNDYILAGGTSTYKTLRERLKMIEGIIDVRTLDYLPAKTMLLVEMNPEVIRGISGMDLTTVSWEGSGGMELFFKVMLIGVPQCRADQNGNTGIIHGTHA